MMVELSNGMHCVQVKRSTINHLGGHSVNNWRHSDRPIFVFIFMYVTILLCSHCKINTFQTTALNFELRFSGKETFTIHGTKSMPR